jgi:prepilin peptidase CpaA
MSMAMTGSITALLLVVAWYDMRWLRIPNALVLLGLALFVAFAPLLTTTDIVLRMTAAAAVFAVALIAFSMRLMGGGDAKFLPVLTLFISPLHWQMALILLAVGVVGTIALLAVARRIPVAARADFRAIAHPDRMPMGPAFAAAGIGPMLMTL